MNLDQNIQALTITDVVTEDGLELTENNIATLDKMLVNRQDSIFADSKHITGFTPQQLAQETSANMDTTTKTQTANPFLPAHILQQLKQDNLNLVEEIAQSGAALTASAALLKTYQRNAPSHFFSSGDPEADKKAARLKAQRYKMVDNLVDEYLPLIAADLKRKLKLQIDREPVEN